MTLDELLRMPKNMSVEEYQECLNKKHRLQRKCRILSDKIEDETDSLEILKDEPGSERYSRHQELLSKYNKQLQKAKEELAQITV